ncbi:MAG: hypothetical protein WCS89_01605 [Candidatus Paceibacterota bacterium]|jgi:hypothetical protein
MNIEIHGFLPDITEQVAESIWRQLNNNLPASQLGDCAVTIVPSRSFDRRGKNAPFLRVYSDIPTDFDLVKTLLEPVNMPGKNGCVWIEPVLLQPCLKI